jgi:hypothetical protein
MRPQQFGIGRGPERPDSVFQCITAIAGLPRARPRDIAPALVIAALPKPLFRGDSLLAKGYRGASPAPYGGPGFANTQVLEIQCRRPVQWSG